MLGQRSNADRNLWRIAKPFREAICAAQCEACPRDSAGACCRLFSASCILFWGVFKMALQSFMFEIGREHLDFVALFLCRVREPKSIPSFFQFLGFQNNPDFHFMFPPVKSYNQPKAISDLLTLIANRPASRMSDSVRRGLNLE